MPVPGTGTGTGTGTGPRGATIGKAAYLLNAVAAGVLLGMLYESAGLLAATSPQVSFNIGILLVLAPAIARLKSDTVERLAG